MINELSSLDRSLFLFLNSINAPVLNSLMTLLSGQFIWLPLIGFFIFSAQKQSGKNYTGYFILFLGLSLIATDVTSSYILKNLFDRLRPCRELDIKPLINFFGQKCGGKFGFVSSHAANSTVLILFSMKNLKFNKWLNALLPTIPVIIGFSRIYLGAHYPGDILGGILIGLFWGVVFSYFFKNIYGANL